MAHTHLLVLKLLNPLSPLVVFCDKAARRRGVEGRRGGGRGQHTKLISWAACDIQHHML